MHLFETTGPESRTFARTGTSVCGSWCSDWRRVASKNDSRAGCTSLVSRGGWLFAFFVMFFPKTARGGEKREEHVSRTTTKRSEPKCEFQVGWRAHRENDPGRTRTWNLWFRRPTPYPLGHRATDACRKCSNFYVTLCVGARVSRSMVLGVAYFVTAMCLLRFAQSRTLSSVVRAMVL